MLIWDLCPCRGTWKKVSKGCYEVRGKTLGIVGYGHIGSQVGVLAEMLGMKVKFFDIASKVSTLSHASSVSVLRFPEDLDHDRDARVIAIL